VKSGEKGHSEFDHVKGLGNDDGLSPESGEPMPLPAVVSFYRHRASFPLE